MMVWNMKTLLMSGLAASVLSAGSAAPARSDTSGIRQKPAGEATVSVSVTRGTTTERPVFSIRGESFPSDVQNSGAQGKPSPVKSGAIGPQVSPRPAGSTGKAPGPYFPMTSVPDDAGTFSNASERGDVARMAGGAVATRGILPSGDFMLENETAERRWMVHLTAAQALDARVELGYESSIFVAPESSSIVLEVNGVHVVGGDIRGAGGGNMVSAEVPAGVLKPGWNEMALRVDQRHRVSCGLDATYDLWTRVLDEETRFVFSAPEADRLSSLEDIRAIGTGGDGIAHVEIVVPGLADAGDQILAVSQAISLITGRDNLSFGVSRTPGERLASADLRIVLGTAGDLAPMQALLPEDILHGGTAKFIEDVELGSVLVISGPDAIHVDAAIREILEVAHGDWDPEVLPTAAWMAPNAPMISGEETFALSDLGVVSRETSAQRSIVEVNIAVPGDFYAEGYGEALVYIDAAFSRSVLPESFINIHVNGEVASVVPVHRRGGGAMENQRVGVTMRNFRPGLNTIRFEAVMRTDGDDACLPGGHSEPRFVLFDTTRIALPDFARLERTPNLAAMTGVGWPYAGAGDVPVVVGAPDPGTYSAAATLVGRLASVAGRPINTFLSSEAESANGRNAVFVGPASTIPDRILDRVGLDRSAGALWAESSPAVTAATESQVRGGLMAASASAPAATGAASRGSPVGEWARKDSRKKEGLIPRGWNSLKTLAGGWFDYPSSNSEGGAGFGEVRPGSGTGLVVAQGPGSGNGTTWTVVAASGSAALKSGVETLVTGATWKEMSDAAVVIGKDGEIERKLVRGTGSFASESWSLANIRMIGANALSNSPAVFATGLVLACLLLGLSTGALLSRLGRSNRD